MCNNKDLLSILRRELILARDTEMILILLIVIRLSRWERSREPHGYD